jgi:tellurite resistance protein TehA-like permease
MRVAPNWFTVAMGTGVVANAAALLPVDLPGLRALALAAWIAGALLLARLGIAASEQWRRDRRDGRVREPHGLAMAPFWGAPPMAVLTIGAGTLLVGEQLIGHTPALVVALTMWAAGTAGGLAALATIPLRMILHPERTLEAVFATWLLPVVPPMVSAMTGAALVPSLPAGLPRSAMLLACCALFVVSLAAIVATKVVIGRRLLLHGTGPERMLPTLFIVLGPLGTSIGAVCLLAAAAPASGGGILARQLDALSLAYGLPIWTFAMVWLAIAATLTLRAAARGELPFAASWWSFIFPLGTCVIGTSELALKTGSTPLQWAAVGLFVALLGAFAVVSGATARHAIWPRMQAVRAAAAAA